ncbi:uncharacterized protein CC84DRAFT_1204709 [Paraphaeosphaeria sporulosa]|uniref:Uncharacterized protein n=1 Tax=Paraphaeosphaeria sporulosa TaxID=1460663 RepID=A0A177CIN5_9PLEO|nr:uncharacterized protein CC84DRAFT_1204709 [Paraphaeosphaeria sporulosa]OAG07121.1 hypothetical protein CC84DRAFT_1204709 [Paraphaeosphaeria sporulosa]
MPSARRGRTGRSRLCRTLCCATYLHLTVAMAQTVVASQTDVTAVAAEMLAASGVDLIPSDHRIAFIASALKTSTKFPTGLIPSAPRTSSIVPSEIEERFFPTGLIPSAPRSSSTVPAPITTISEGTPTPAHTALIPSAPVSSIPEPTTLSTITFPTLTLPAPTNGTVPVGTTNVIPTFSPTGMTSTQEGLHPIPAPSTNPGDPDGHHEVPEPNFTITVPCRGCSPVVEITATGWGTVPTFPIKIPPAQEVETKASSSPVITLSVGPSNVVIKPNPSGSDFVIGDSTTIKPGQTVTVGGSPVAVHTSNGHTDVIIGGTQTMPLQPPTNPPVATVTVGGSPIAIKPAPSSGAFLIGDSTVAPGQTLTLSNTPIAIHTSGALTQIVAGTQTIPLAPADAQITDAPVPIPIALPNGATLTPLPIGADGSSPQGYILASQTLLPGGAPIVVSGTTYALALGATALAINGQTTTLRPSYGALLTTVAAPPLTLFGTVYTANRAGYYALAPGTTLVPGGPAVTVSGTVISLVPEGTAAVIQGSTSAMQPLTAVVTVVTSGDGVGQTGSMEGAPLPTVGKHSAGMNMKRGGAWIDEVLVLGMLVVAWLGIRL